jgi:hypothetical protein
MENNKQTAVEYLEKAIDKYVACIEGNPDAKIFTSSNLYLTVEQAKEMEKQQQDLLNECEIQLEYLNQKFGETGTTNALLSKLKNK